jgi:hypothetical protein
MKSSFFFIIWLPISFKLILHYDEKIGFDWNPQNRND